MSFGCPTFKKLITFALVIDTHQYYCIINLKNTQSDFFIHIVSLLDGAK